MGKGQRALKRPGQGSSPLAAHLLMGCGEPLNGRSRGALAARPRNSRPVAWGDLALRRRSAWG